MKRQFLNIMMVVNFLWCVQPMLNAAEGYESSLVEYKTEVETAAAVLLALSKHSTQTTTPKPARPLPAQAIKGIKTIFNEHEYTQAQCPICKETKNLTDRTWKLHIDKEKEYVKNGWKCPICNKITSSYKRFTVHTRLVHEDKTRSFRCSTCLQEVKQAISLSSHYKHVHKGYTEFQCGACDEWYPHTYAAEAEHKCKDNPSKRKRSITPNDAVQE